MGIKPSDKSVFDAVYEENAEKIYRVALHYSRDHYAAEDITQKAFMALYVNKEDVDPKRYVAWLKRTARNFAVNYYKHAEYEVQFPTEYIQEKLDGMYYEQSLEELLDGSIHEEEQQILVQGISKELYDKNPDWYKVLMYTYVLKKPPKEIAELMGISIGKLRVMLHRSKKWIKKRYPEAWDHLDDA